MNKNIFLLAILVMGTTAFFNQAEAYRSCCGGRTGFGLGLVTGALVGSAFVNPVYNNNFYPNYSNGYAPYYYDYYAPAYNSPTAYYWF